MRPLIGVNCDIVLHQSRLKIELWQNYAQAIELAGGMPILLPPTTDEELVQAQVNLVSGLVLVGGYDYDPRLYGLEPHPMIMPLNSTRAAYDVKLAGAALQRSLPVLGICAGLQLVNIVRGGTLHRDLPEIPGISKEHAGHLLDDAHDVIIEKGSRLAAAVGQSQLPVNSTHHQAVARLGRGLRVTARSADSVIEAIESTQPDEFLLCVQWHPERLIDRPQHLALFKTLVQASTKVDGSRSQYALHPYSPHLNVHLNDLLTRYRSGFF